jgi:single-strand DNA-binding protein
MLRPLPEAADNTSPNRKGDNYMRGYNRVIIAGNLTKDPELKYTTKGAAICEFNLAINRSWRDESGQQKEEVTFVGVKAWGKTGENIAKFLKKGRPILIEGRIAQDSWDDKQTGQKRSKTYVVAEQFQFLDSAQGGAGSSGTAQPRSDVEQTPASARPEDPKPEEDDVPF